MLPWNKPKPIALPAQEPFFAWTEDLRIGIRRFDLEHESMGELVNLLHSLMVVERDRARANQAIETLLQATREHFTHEEALLSDLGYPEREAHFHEHTALLDELRDLQRQFKAGSLSALAMPSFLKKWLVEHIKNTDRLYVDFLKLRGVS